MTLDSIPTMLQDTTMQVAPPDTCFVVPLPVDTVKEGGSDDGIDLKQILNDNFFTRRLPPSTTHQSSASQGVAGDPVPYTIRGDSMISMLLIVCFILFMVSVTRSQRFITRQLKRFFDMPHGNDDSSETGVEMRFLLFVALVDCLVLSIASYLFAKQTIAEDHVLGSDFLLVVLLFGMFVVYFGLKSVLYTIVNLVFFDGNKNLQWMRSQLFLTAGEGVLLFPLVLLQVYFDLSLESAAVYFIFVLILNKFLTFYKSWIIFFRQKSVFLQNILYFCALEIAPLLAFGGALVMTIELLIIKF